MDFFITSHEDLLDMEDTVMQQRGINQEKKLFDVEEFQTYNSDPNLMADKVVGFSVMKQYYASIIFKVDHGCNNTP